MLLLLNYGALRPAGPSQSGDILYVIETMRGEANTNELSTTVPG